MENIKIKIPQPAWYSELVSIILQLEKLRGTNDSWDLPKHIFRQLKEVFHILETLGSARIEGNNTTLSDYVEHVISGDRCGSEKNLEIENLQRAIKFIEDVVDTDFIIDRAFISELHKIVTYGLTPPPKGEGSRYPGELRKHNVTIAKAKHQPPDWIVLPDYFDEFIRFINQDLKAQNQLLMVAIAHHRFSYIHPFDNGNGRVGRLLNYALLIKLGFNVGKERIFNPSSVFYSDRNKYYEMLAKADSLEDEDVLQWCEYFLKGLLNEINKIDSLSNKNFVLNKILRAAVDFARDRMMINDREYKILKLLLSKSNLQIKSTDLSEIGITDSVKKSRAIAALREKNILMTAEGKARVYTINIANSYLLRGIIEYLTKLGFVSEFLG